jgi:hypothetical protein
MARRKRTSKTSSKRRLSASQIIFYILSLIIILSMAIGFVISAFPGSNRQQSVPTPTPIIFATITPTPTQGLTATPMPATEQPASGVATPSPGQ